MCYSFFLASAHAFQTSTLTVLFPLVLLFFYCTLVQEQSNLLHLSFFLPPHMYHLSNLTFLAYAISLSSILKLTVFRFDGPYTMILTNTSSSLR